MIYLERILLVLLSCLARTLISLFQDSLSSISLQELVNIDLA